MTAPLGVLDGLDAEVVVADTTQMTRPDWLMARRSGIGGSDAAAIVGLDRWRSAFAVWLDKTSADLPDDGDSEAAEWGRRLEGVVADAVAEREGVQLVELPSLLAHRDRSWQRANVDRIVLDARRPDRPGVYEGKTAGVWVADDWNNDEVPDGYVLQGQHYLAVTGLSWLLFGCLIGGQRLVTRVVLRDDELIDHLTSIEAEFWQRCVEGVAPEPDGSVATTDLLAHLWDVKPESVVTVNVADVEPLIGAYQQAHLEAKAASERKAEAANRLKAVLADHETAVGPDGQVLFRWPQITSRKVDLDLLRSAHTQIADSCTRTATTRRLTIPKRKG